VDQTHDAGFAHALGSYEGDPAATRLDVATERLAELFSDGLLLARRVGLDWRRIDLGHNYRQRFLGWVGIFFYCTHFSKRVLAGGSWWLFCFLFYYPPPHFLLLF
jgi:hypothetical protein